MRRPAPGSGFAHQNGGQRVCGEPSANPAGAAAGKRKISAMGLRIKAEDKGFAGSRAQTAPALQREKRKIPAMGLRIKTENKGFAGNRAQTAPALQREKRKSRLRVCASKRRTKGLRGVERKPRRREKSRRLSLVNGGGRRRHIRIIQFYGVPETCGRGECVFLWGVKR